MQFTYAAISALLASVAYSQTIASELAQLPSCSLTCISTAVTGAGCTLTDYACQCGTGKDAITKSATPCISAACSASDSLSVQKITNQICALQAASGSSSSASSAVSSASSAASSAISGMSSATGSAIASATSAASATATTNAGNRVAAGAMVGAGFLAALAL